MRRAVLVWVVVIFVVDVLLFRVQALVCRLGTSTSGVLILADIQMHDSTSYSFAPRGSLLLSLVTWYSDLYLRRSIAATVSMVSPAAVVLLGDVFDGGWQVEDQEYAASMARLRGVMPALGGARLLNLSGNHDVSFRTAAGPEARRRYVKHFGPLNWRRSVAGLDLVAISSLTLSPGDGDPEAAAETQGFLASLPAASASARVDSEPRVLLTHVPLWRPEGTECGPLNPGKTGDIYERYGWSYRTTLSRTQSADLLASVHPAAVISGDNHDWCVVTHDAAVTEYTVGTPSWLMGTRWPSVAILARSDAGVRVDACFLVDQLRVYYFLIALALATPVAVWRLLTSALGTSPKSLKAPLWGPTARITTKALVVGAIGPHLLLALLL